MALCSCMAWAILHTPGPAPSSCGSMGVRMIMSASIINIYSSCGCVFCSQSSTATGLLIPLHQHAIAQYLRSGTAGLKPRC